jgi:hypothetical protein
MPDGDEFHPSATLVTRNDYSDVARIHPPNNRAVAMAVAVSPGCQAITLVGRLTVLAPGDENPLQVQRWLRVPVLCAVVMAKSYVCGHLAWDATVWVP